MRDDMVECRFKWYVINYDINKREIVQFNIFNNWRLNDEVYYTLKKYLRAPKKFKKQIDEHTGGLKEDPVTHEWKYVPTTYKYIYGFEALCEEIRSLIMWQEWSRCEYEIAVGDHMAETIDRTFKKIDCYWQCEKNIPMIAREVIHQYKEWEKLHK